MLWNSDNISISPFEAFNQCLTVRLRKKEASCVLSCIYRSPRQGERRGLWAHLMDLNFLLQTEVWAWIGDFNSYLLSDEKKGGSGPNMRSMADFRACVDYCSMIDIGYAAPKFTWNNGNIWEHIDRCQ